MRHHCRRCADKQTSAAKEGEEEEILELVNKKINSNSKINFHPRQTSARPSSLVVVVVVVVVAVVDVIADATCNEDITAEACSNQ